MKVLLAVDQSQDAQVAARFLEAVRLPRGAALSIVHATEVRMWRFVFRASRLCWATGAKRQRLTRVD